MKKVVNIIFLLITVTSCTNKYNEIKALGMEYVLENASQEWIDMIIDFENPDVKDDIWYYSKKPHGNSDEPIKLEDLVEVSRMGNNNDDESLNPLNKRETISVSWETELSTLLGDYTIHFDPETYEFIGIDMMY